jgi:SAM-dependent methyltransferase
MQEMSDLGMVAWEKINLDQFTAPLRVSIDLFLKGCAVFRDQVQTAMGSSTLACFESAGLLRASAADPAALVCPVWLYPVRDYVLISDRRDDPDGKPFTTPEDVVFPAIYAGTLRFLRLLPDELAGDALDLCGGSGIAALVMASRSAARSVTADLTPRSAFFAEFNARLNDLPVESLCGDLYDPIQRSVFDIITAHPPFVPALGGTMIYRDGGETGEEVTRRVVEGFPAHLRPGGTGIILCVARDTLEKPIEQRVHDWLGPAAPDFDIIFGLEKVLSLEDVITSVRKRGGLQAEADVITMVERLKNCGTRQFVYGAIFVRRLPQPLGLDPGRVQMSPQATANDFFQLFAWRARTRLSNFRDWLAHSQPRPAPELELTARYRVTKGELSPREFVFSIDGRFRAAMRPDGWLVPLIARLTGQRTVAQVYEQARADNEILVGFSLDDFLRLVSRLVENGIFLIPEDDTSAPHPRASALAGK